jgi:hypothetical protein
MSYHTKPIRGENNSERSILQFIKNIPLADTNNNAVAIELVQHTLHNLGSDLMGILRIKVRHVLGRGELLGGYQQLLGVTGSHVT